MVRVCGLFWAIVAGAAVVTITLAIGLVYLGLVLSDALEWIEKRIVALTTRP